MNNFHMDIVNPGIEDGKIKQKCVRAMSVVCSPRGCHGSTRSAIYTAMLGGRAKLVSVSGDFVV